jgi:hypothetical protein
MLARQNFSKFDHFRNFLLMIVLLSSFLGPDQDDDYNQVLENEDPDAVNT